jgi:radical SAM protein with 4Fe4S-binding SPASM domain
VSFDGLGKTHDRLRGVSGSFDSAREALRNLRAAGVPVSANTQINRLSVPELPELLELLGAEGAHSWQLQMTVPMGRGADEPEVLLEPYELLEVFPLLARLKQRSLELGVLIWPGNNVGYFGPYEHALRGHVPIGHMASCSAGKSVLGLEADGSIKGCPSLPTEAWTGGNIREHTLEEIWERSAQLRYTRDRTVDDLWGFCRGCYYAETCMAGCTWTSFVFFGKPGNNPYCHHRALEMQKRGQRERLVQVESAPGTPFDHSRFEIVVESLEKSA